jgi:metallo-beta-lactamase family protein
MASIRFLGAAGTVTGSRFLVRAHGRQVLVDAGLFQGQKELRLRNWAPFPVEPGALDAVVLTHAHIDHSGALPLLVRQGFRGPAYCTPATRDLATLLLPDSGRLQEEEARFANQKGYSKHAPHARPLYDEADALAALSHLVPAAYRRRQEVVPGVAVTFHRAGHILGSATVEMEIAAGGGAPATRVLFSRWLDTLPAQPSRVFCVHGEPPALAATAARLAARGWEARVAQDQEEVDLGP